ncbi:endonuclease VII domain-containing protein [Mesorhizobium sp. M0139]|uniref:endonuclease VII domain-containing protein n=1 Tax=Mesorhizobium sp. M0139 TaxID=2956892 RepID=UPI0033367E86
MPVSEAQKKWRSDNADLVREYRRNHDKKKRDAHRESPSAYYQRTKERHSAKNRISKLKRVYGITPEQWDALFEGQGHRCAVCGSTEPRTTRGRGWQTDHCHATGKVRGILCFRCNIGLGKFEDDTDRLASAIAYLKLHSR